MLADEEAGEGSREERICEDVEAITLERRAAACFCL